MKPYVGVNIYECTLSWYVCLCIDKCMWYELVLVECNTEYLGQAASLLLGALSLEMASIESGTIK